MTVITDDFTRADGDIGSSAEGWSWTEVAGDYSIASNQATTSGTANNTQTYARAESDLDTDDHYAEADVSWNSTAGTAQPAGVMVRFDPAAETGYAGVWDATGEIIAIQKIEAGSISTIASRSEAAASSRHIRLEVDGSDLTLQVDSLDPLTVSDSDITGNTRTGLRGRVANASDRYQTWDNFEAGDLGAGGQDITPAAQTVDITPGTLSMSLGVTPGAVTVEATPGALTVSTDATDITPAAVTIEATPGTATLTTGAVDITPDAVTIDVTPGTLTLDLDVALAGPTIEATPGTLTVAAGVADITPDPVTVGVTPGTVTISGGGIADPNPANLKHQEPGGISHTESFAISYQEPA